MILPPKLSIIDLRLNCDVSGKMDNAYVNGEVWIHDKTVVGGGWPQVGLANINTQAALAAQTR